MRKLPVMLLLTLTLLLAACSRPGESPSTTRTFTDPFAYCAAVGTIDTPDDRYQGPKVPLAVAQGLRRAFGLPATAPIEPFMRGTYFRCMDGKVYACNVGANLPCLEKADVSRTPSAGMSRYCEANPNVEFIPAYVTGRATVFAWRCSQGKAQVVRQVAKPDARGFLANFWHLIDPSAAG